MDLTAKSVQLALVVSVVVWGAVKGRALVSGMETVFVTLDTLAICVSIVLTVTLEKRVQIAVLVPVQLVTTLVKNAPDLKIINVLIVNLDGFFMTTSV